MKSSTKLPRSAIAFGLILIGSGLIVRTATAAKEQLSASSSKSGRVIDVWSAAASLARNAAANRELAAPSPLDTAAQHTYPTPESEVLSDVEVNGEAHRCPKIVTFDVPGAVATQPFAINVEGAIVGNSLDANQTIRGFLREPDGTFISINAPDAGSGPGGYGTLLWSINQAGEIAGTYRDQKGVIHSFLRERDGKLTTFDAPGAGTGSLQGTNGININRSGAIAGEYVDDANVFHGFVRECDGTITTFDVPGAGTGAGQGTFTSSTDGINPRGDISGWYVDDANAYRGFVRARDGRIVTFDVPGSGTGPSQGSEPAGINERGETLGSYIDENNVAHGFLRAPNGRIKKFDIPGAGTGTGQGTQPANINFDGDMSGDYIDIDGTYHGFIRDRDGTVIKFDVPGAGTGPQYRGTFPVCNNATDAVTGYYFDANGMEHGFLRTSEALHRPWH